MLKKSPTQSLELWRTSGNGCMTRFVGGQGCLVVSAVAERFFSPTYDLRTGECRKDPRHSGGSAEINLPIYCVDFPSDLYYVFHKSIHDSSENGWQRQPRRRKTQAHAENHSWSDRRQHSVAGAAAHCHGDRH